MITANSKSPFKDPKEQNQRSKKLRQHVALQLTSHAADNQML